MSLDRQIAPRIPLAVEVEFRKSYSRSQNLGTLRNISLTGAFLEKETAEFIPGDKLQLVLNVGSRVRKLVAEVVWKGQKGVGVKFHHSNNRDIQIVDDLMYFVLNKRESQKDVLGDILDKVG
jgi:hypothetical protein